MVLNKVRDYKYGEDHIVNADMDQRHKSYLYILVAKLNETIDALNAEIESRKNLEKEFEKRVVVAEKKAAERITHGEKTIKEGAE